MRQIILATVSPRRRQLFKLFGLKFKAADSGYEEVFDDKMTPEQLVQFLALGKARAAAKKYPNSIIVAADTVVVFRGKVLGKPKNRSEAVAMLKSFSGKKQRLVTGLAVLDAASGKMVKEVIASDIYFKKLASAVIARYIKTENPYDKAGGYNLQGGGINLLAKIGGDFTNNLGLPMGKVFNALIKLGVKI